jgi:hypothetical protein
MKVKKGSIVFSIVIAILLLSIALIVKNILNKESKEVVVAKKFIEKLCENNIIEEYNNSKSIVEEGHLNKLANKNSQIQYSVIVGKYGVDIDKNYNVLGFSNKNTSIEKNKDIIAENEAVSLATRYVSEITDDDFRFKEVRVREGEESPCHNVVFYKYRDGYPYYKQEINAMIDKRTGKLEGYSNYPLDHIKHIDKININEEDASNSIKKYFVNLNLKAETLGDPTLYYISIKDDKMALAYVYNVKVINSDNKEEKVTIFLEADSGEIINSNLEAVAKS